MRWDYSLQGNRKTLEGDSIRTGKEFRHISRRVEAFQRQGQPVVSVDTKKKLSPYRNGGREWRPKGEPEAVKVHDFVDPELGKAIPYGVYDMTANAGWVSVGVARHGRVCGGDGAAVVAADGSSCLPPGRTAVDHSRRGGSNSSRSRLRKYELQNLADGLGLSMSVCHFPPGTSKWNKIEHRSSVITENSRPLVSREVVVNIGATKGAAWRFNPNWTRAAIRPARR